MRNVFANHCRVSRRRRGFTFIEVAVATVVIGLGMAGLVSMMGASGKVNSSATELTTAMNLANNIHELTERLLYTDGHWGKETGETISNCDSCDDLNGMAPGSGSTTVVDCVGQPMPTVAGMDWSGWQQQISCALVDPTNVTQTIASTDTSVNNVMRITCTIVHNSATVYQQSWIVVQTK
jgi:prepilin-type N-terminal cleavage/methylation domain-containing protein